MRMLIPSPFSYSEVGLSKRLRMEIRSKHYSMVNADTACHQLYGFKVALEQLGLLDESKCFVYPDHFKEKEADNHG